MDNEKELNYLKSVLKMKETTEPPVIFKPVFSLFLWVLFGVLIVPIKMHYESSEMNTYLFMLIIMLLSTVVSMYVFYKHAYKSWFYLKPHVNFSSIEKTIEKQ